MLKSILTTIILSIWSQSSDIWHKPASYDILQTLTEVNNWQNSDLYIYSKSLYNPTTDMAFSETGRKSETASVLNAEDKELLLVTKLTEEQKNLVCTRIHDEVVLLAKEQESFFSKNQLNIPYEWLAVNEWARKIDSKIPCTLELKRLDLSSPRYEHISTFTIKNSEERDYVELLYAKLMKDFLDINKISFCEVDFTVKINRYTNGTPDEIIITINSEIVIDMNSKKKIKTVTPDIKYLHSFWNATNPISKNWEDLLLDLKNKHLKEKFEDYTHNENTVIYDKEKHTALAMVWKVDQTITSNEEIVIEEQIAPVIETYDRNKNQIELQETNKNMPIWLKYYNIPAWKWMTGSMIEVESMWLNNGDLVPNYITVQSDPDLFPIQKNPNLTDEENRAIFSKAYKIKYWSVPVFAHAWARWENGKPIWLNKVVNNVNGKIVKEVYNNWGNWWTGSVWVKHWKLHLGPIADANKYDEVFQERLWFNQTEWNRFPKGPWNTNLRRWIIQTKSWRTFIWQSADIKQSMYDNINNDWNSVVFTMPDGSKDIISKAVSIESVWSGKVLVQWADDLGWEREPQWASLPDYNLVVYTKMQK